MRKSLAIFAVSLAFLLGGTPAIHGQSKIEAFRTHNQKMAAYQPALITPLVTPDPRLMQYARFSVSHQYTAAHAETITWGNCRGAGIVVGKRWEFDWIPPTYVVHNSKAKDGAGDTSLLAKYRVASGNAENGNYIVAAAVSRTFPTGSYSNGAATGSFTPIVSAAWAHRRLDVISSISGLLPTGEVARQGRTANSNTALQFHPARPIWIEVENNATFFHGGSHDGEMQNFVLPAGLLVVRSKRWRPAHPYFIVDSGMQIATSHFHTYDHNLITEVRMLF
jgi:hypothetical protein